MNKFSLAAAVIVMAAVIFSAGCIGSQSHGSGSDIIGVWSAPMKVAEFDGSVSGYAVFFSDGTGIFTYEKGGRYFAPATLIWSFRDGRYTITYTVESTRKFGAMVDPVFTVRDGILYDQDNTAYQKVERRDVEGRWIVSEPYYSETVDDYVSASVYAGLGGTGSAYLTKNGENLLSYRFEWYESEPGRYYSNVPGKDILYEYCMMGDVMLSFNGPSLYGEYGYKDSIVGIWKGEDVYSNSAKTGSLYYEAFFLNGKGLAIQKNNDGTVSGIFVFTWDENDDGTFRVDCDESDMAPQNLIIDGNRIISDGNSGCVRVCTLETNPVSGMWYSDRVDDITSADPDLKSCAIVLLDDGTGAEIEYQSGNVADAYPLSWKKNGDASYVISSKTGDRNAVLKGGVLKETGGYTYYR